MIRTSAYKEGTLHSGKGGKVVKNPKQAIAIALSEAGISKPWDQEPVKWETLGRFAASPSVTFIRRC